MTLPDNEPIVARNIKDRISEAQSIAKDAVKADNFHCFEEAILLYETAINEIKQILEFSENERINNHTDNVISETDFILLQNIHSAYYDRLNFLKENTNNNYTRNLKNIEVEAPPKIQNINLKQPNFQQEFEMINDDIELQHIKKFQEFQNNLDLFDNLDFYSMQNNHVMDNQKRTQNMNDISEMLYEDSLYENIKPPNYIKSTNFNVPVVKNKFGVFVDDESNVSTSLLSNSNDNIFNHHNLSSAEINKINTIPENKNGIEPIASNNIFINNLNSNNTEVLPVDTSPINGNMNIHPDISRNSILMNNNNNINSSLNINTSSMGMTSPKNNTIPIIPSAPITSEKPSFNMNENNSIPNKKPIKPLKVLIPKRNLSLSRKSKAKSNPYMIPLSSKLISRSQSTPTTPSTSYLPFPANDSQVNPTKESNSSFQALPYSIDYLLKEKPNNEPKPEMLPPKLILRPFWIMRLLSRSMLEGGYLTPRVYVPRQLWYQRGVKYVAIENKYKACVSLIQHLQRIKNTNIENSSDIYDALRILETEMKSIQTILCKKLKYIEEIIEIGPVISLDKKITMSLLWKYGYELNLMREIPYENDNTRSAVDSGIGNGNGNDPFYSTNSHFHGDDYGLNYSNEFNSAISIKSNPGYSMPNDDLIKSTKSITDLTNGRVPENRIEDNLFPIRGPGSYSVSSISINSNVTSSSKLAHTKSRLSRSMDKLSYKKGDKVDDISGYIEVLVTLFNEAQFFVDWINYIEAKGKANPNELQYIHIHNQLGRISFFFGRVICTFVLKDFEMLLDRYLYKLRQNIFY